MVGGKISAINKKTTLMLKKLGGHQSNYHNNVSLIITNKEFSKTIKSFLSDKFAA